MNKIRDVMRGGAKEEVPIELQNRFASLLETYNQMVEDYHRLVASQAQDAKELSSLRELKPVLEHKIAVLDRELQACKDDLFRVQPMSQVPDSTIAQRFEIVDAQICDWTGTEISEFLDTWQPKHPGAQPQLFHHGGSADSQNFLAEYPEMGGEYIVRHVIHRFLQKMLFNDGIYLFGLDTKYTSFLNIIEHGMSKLEPSREAATIRTWRSEALASLAKTREFSVQLEKARKRLTMDLFDQLLIVFPIIGGRQASLDTLYAKIIAPAVELAISMQTSTSSYRFEPWMSSSSVSRRYKISRKDLGHFRITDVGTGKTLKPESPVTPDRDGDIGTQMIVLAPGLLRADADKSVSLSQEAILIKLYHPLGRRRAATEDTK